MDFDGEVLYLIELNQEETSLIQQVENPPNETDIWLKNESNLSANDSTMYLNVGPCLGEGAQISEISNTAENLRVTQQVKISKKSIVSPSILRVNKNKKKSSSESTTAGGNVLIKNDILLTKTPKVLEMMFINNIAHITFKDEQGHQMFLTQQLKVTHFFL